MIDEQQSRPLQSVLEWARPMKTSSRWLPANPARGQRSVTALVVQDILGGDIAKTTLDGARHFYNLIGGVRRDFAESQFVSTVFFGDLPSGWDEAFSDTSPTQYRILG